MYLCIDLKTFYASVECVERGLDPFGTNLVVADVSRGKGSICLAVSPKMKMLGVKNRCRIFEIPDNIRYIAAKPRMSKYIEYSANIYAVYLKYFSKDDIYVYSIDEVFIDVSKYLKMYEMDVFLLARRVVDDVYASYGITATVGIGTNMYLAKIALDITAKHSANNMGYLDEEKFKKELWHHKPLTDFWQIGKGIEKRLNRMCIYDMYDISHTDERRLYKEFGINAELMIDHACGKESCTIDDIKVYKTKSRSMSNSQILFRDYSYEEALLVVKEMVELGSLRLVESGLVTSTVKLYIGYSKNIIPATGGTYRLDTETSTYTELVRAFLAIYHKTTNPMIPIRRVGITFCNVVKQGNKQLSLFIDENKNVKEEKLEKAISKIKYYNGKNSIIRGMDLESAATTIMRNKLIGGHNSA